MPYCAVPGCTNGTSASNSAKGGVSYHRLPSNPDLAAKWWQLIRRDEAVENVRDPRVCSDHFPPRFISKSGRVSREALPTLAIPNNPPRYVISVLLVFIKV